MRHRGARLVGLAMTLAAIGAALPATAAEKIILDTDFNTIGDDGQALVMLANARHERDLRLLGITVVSGNQWRDQGMVDALKAVERLGIAGEVGVHAGADDPLIHDLATLELEQKLFGRGYAGAWRKPRPTERDLVAPPDGLATAAKPSTTDAVDFLVETIEANPREVTILAIGPLTNLALALRKSPQIVPLVKRIVYMGGAVDVPGNVTPAAEFNWWFDPEAARIVLRQPIEHVIVPLDVSDKTRFGKDVYDRVSAAGTPIAKLFAAEYAETFAQDPAARAEVWDTVAAAYVLDPTIATDVRERWIDVDVAFGPNYGRSLGHMKNPPVGAQQAKVVFAIDQGRFWKLYTDLLSR